jgi:RNA polymerase sigma factor (TIGR02999 family)
MPLVYDQLRKLAARRMRGQRGIRTLQPTALVNEVYLKLHRHPSLAIQDRTHFMALAATAMRQVLVDQARRRSSQKRGGGVLLVSLDHLPGVGDKETQNFLDIHRAIDELNVLDPIAAQIVELRYFAGLTEVEIAKELGYSERWVRQRWTHARAWLRNKLAS